MTTRNTGRMLYVPRPVCNRLDQLAAKKNKKKREAWDDLLFFSDVGMNVDDFYGGLFGKRK